jgi:integrase
MRIGETIQLKLSDIDFDSKPTLIRIRGVTTKTQESRETFLTTEATNSLKDYLTRYFNWKENEPNNLQDLVILVVLNVVSVN